MVHRGGHQLVHTLLFNIKIKNGIHIYKNMNTVYQLIGLYIIIYLNTKPLVLFPRFRLYPPPPHYQANIVNICHLPYIFGMGSSSLYSLRLSYIFVLSINIYLYGKTLYKIYNIGTNKQ